MNENYLFRFQCIGHGRKYFLILVAGIPTLIECCIWRWVLTAITSISYYIRKLSGFNFQSEGADKLNGFNIKMSKDSTASGPMKLLFSHVI